MTKTIETTLICPDCGNSFPIRRKSGKQKELCHRKKLYCYICKKETNQVEARDLDSLLASLIFVDGNRYTNEEKEIMQLIKKRGERNDN